MPVAYAPAGGSSNGTTARKNASGVWIVTPGAVAGVGLGAGRAAVVEAAHRGERLVEDRVALAALHVDDEADAAAVVLEARVVETLRGRQIRDSRVRVGCGRDRPRDVVLVLGRSAPKWADWNWPPRDDIGPSAVRRL